MRRAAAVALLAIAVSAGGGVAHAGGTPHAGTPRAGTPTSSLGFSIAAVGSKRWFVLPAAAGEHVGGQLRVRNLTARPREIELGATDATTAAAGGFAFSPARPAQAGGWISLSRSSVRLPGYAETVVPFTVAVPPGAPAGQHFAGITAVDLGELRRVAAARSARHGQFSVLVLSRAGIAVETDLPGAPTRRLALRDASLAVLPAGPALALDLANVGNRLIPSTAVSLSLQGARRPAIRWVTALSSFLTFNTLDYQLPWHGTLAPGAYRLTGWIRPLEAPAIRVQRTVTVSDEAVRQFRQHAGVSVINPGGVPLAIYLALAVAALLVLGMGYALVRGRRKVAA